MPIAGFVVSEGWHLSICDMHVDITVSYNVTMNDRRQEQRLQKQFKTDTPAMWEQRETGIHSGI